MSWEEAARLAEITEAERRMAKDDVIEYALRIASAYPSNSNRDVEVYQEELCMELYRFHPDVIEAVVYGEDRIQATSKFSPSVFELRAALEAAHRERFGHLRKARCALAVYAAQEHPGFRDALATHRLAPNWIVALEQDAGDEALELVKKVIEAAEG